MITDEEIFNAIRERRGIPLSQEDVRVIDDILYPRQIPSKALKIIKEFEGLRLKAYPDPGTGDEPWTIGWGFTFDEKGNPISPGDIWTEKRANDHLITLVKKYAHEVDELLGTAPATGGQFSALVSFAYNLGVSELRKSTLLRMHKEGNYAGAEQQFKRWVYANGRVMDGLIRRRIAEAKLYAS